MKIEAPNAELIARRDWSDGLATFTVRPTGWELPDFCAGQFTNLALPEDGTWGANDGAAIRRAYSIASPPGDDAMEFFIRRVDGGALTPKLFELEIGDPIWLDSRIAGHFTLASAQDAEELLLVGTGTGVAPYRSMILGDRDALSRFGRVVLLYSERFVKDLGHYDEFLARTEEDSRFLFLPTVTREERGDHWRGLHGRVNVHLAADAYKEITGGDLTPARCQIYLCGNPDMIRDVQGDLEARGFRKHRRREPGQLHVEKYW